MAGKVSRAVIFDLDGVLVDSTAVVERAWRWWAEENGLALDAVLRIAHGRPSRDVVRELAPELDADEQAVRLDSWEEEHSGGLEAVPGAAECMTTAGRAAWGVVTSGGRELAETRLLAAGLDVPSVLVTADDVQHGKPHPEPYRRAAEALGIAAASCLVVEDAPAGIASAKAAGMTVLAVTTTHPSTELGDADLVFSSMHEVDSYLRGAGATRYPSRSQ